MGARKVIIVLIALRLDGTRGFNGSVTPRELISSSTLRVASTTAWATSNDGVAQNYAANEQRQERQKAKAPLVDSTLLRFLSSQKSGSVLRRDVNGKASAGSAIPLDYPNGARGVEVDFHTFAAKNLIEGEAEEMPTVSSAVDSQSDNPIERQSWLSQYNAQRVALKLQALGVDSQAAIKSGQIVQDYVLARVTRRRIRKFLQERDALWEYGYSVPLGRKGIEDLSPVAANSFDLDGVITVMVEYGLTGNDVAAIFSHTPSVAMMRARITENGVQVEDINQKRRSFALEENLDRTFVGLLSETLKLRRYDARKVLRASPGLLTSKGSASAVQVIDLLVSLGSSTNSIARDKASLPTLLCRSPALIFRLVAFLSSAQIKVPLSAIGPMLRQKQSADLLNAVAPVKRPLSLDAYVDIASKNLTSVNTDSEILGFLKLDNTVRQQTIDKNYRSIEVMAGVLRRSAGIRDFRKILASHPGAFFLNVTNIHLMTHYLREEVGMTKEDIGKAIQTFPTLLEQDVSRVKDVAEFLSALDVDEDALPSILRSFPATLLLDIEKDMIPVITFLRGIGVRNIGRFVTRLPPVLGYSVEDDLKPKWDFLKEVCQFDYFEVVRFPAYFSYPLERVIRMRYEYLRDCKQIPIQLARVDDVLRYGDRDFATEIALDNDNGEAFAKFVGKRCCVMHPTIRRRKQRKRKRL